MEIVITYRRRGATRVETLTLTPEEYFDPIEPGENHRDHATARLWDACEYVDLSPDDLDWINVEIRSDDGAPAENQLREYHSNGRITVSTNHGFTTDGSRSYEDVVVETELEPMTFHMLRLYREHPSKRWSVNLNGILKSREGRPDAFENLGEGRPGEARDDSPNA